jgi:hypothetical protein
MRRTGLKVVEAGGIELVASVKVDASSLERNRVLHGGYLDCIYRYAMLLVLYEPV